MPIGERLPRSRRLWSVLAIVLVAGLALVAWQARRSGPAHAADDRGVGASLGTPDWIAPILQPDGRSVTVNVDVNTLSGYCLDDGLPALTPKVTETSATVRIQVRASRVKPASSGNTCSSVGHIPVPLTVRLSRPLDQRSLVDAATGHRHQVLDAAGVLTPSYLPPGYGQMALGWDETQADIVSRSYQRLPRAADGNDQSLLIERRPLPDQPLYNEQVLARGTVLGRAARVAKTGNFDDEVCAIWSDQQHVWWVCSLGSPKAALDPAQLLRIGNSIR
jgi:hypothetical protein